MRPVTHKHAVLAAVFLAWGFLPCEARSFAGETGQRTSASGETPQNNAFRMRKFDLDVAIDYPNEQLSGEARLELENWTRSPATTVSLLLNRLMKFQTVRSAGGALLPVSQEIVTFSDSAKQQVNRLLVRLPTPVPPGRRTSLSLRYAGYLVGYTETGSLYIQDRIAPEFTILRADAFAFPVVAAPSWETNKSVPIVDFAFETRVTVPEGLTVACGGELVSKGADGNLRTWHYRSRAPVPFLNIAIAKYDLRDENGIRLYSFPKDAAGAQRVMQGAGRALELFTRWFGPLGAPPRIVLIEIPENWGSQASLTGGIVLAADSFQRAAELSPLYHEISHLWNAPDTERLSPRWSEGLASYVQRKMMQELDGWRGLQGDFDVQARRMLEMGRKDPKLATTPFAAYGRESMTDYSYSVGAICFYLLDRVVGTQKFNEIVGGYYQEYRRKGGNSSDFVAFAESRGGVPAKKVLNDWFSSTRWWDRLHAGESLEEMERSYLKAP